MTGSAQGEADAWEIGRKAWPAVVVGPEELAAHVRRLSGVADGAAPDLQGEDMQAERMHAADLYLACGAALGRRAALDEIERICVPLVAAAVAKVGRTGIQANEAGQLVRVRLLVARDGKPGKIAEYSGHGSLRNWLRVVVVRMILSLATAPVREHAFEETILARLLGAGGDAELAYIKNVYVEAFRTAFHEALASLGARERSLIRMAFLEGLTVDALGAIHGVHRATAARWVVQAERTLVDAVHAQMKEHLGIDGDEYASIIRLVRSQFDITLERYLSA